MSIELFLGFVMVVSLAVYSLTAGADFGGGVWDLLASGPRAQAQRDLIKRVIAPIWEANHVWLIVVVVVMFVAFPKAYATISTFLHIPLTLMLVGIVLRGSAFVFRSYDDTSDEAQRRWSRIFSIASAVTPVMLGMTLAAVASGSIPTNALKTPGKLDFFSVYMAPWLGLFPLAVGGFILTIFAYVAAVYLTLETDDDALREDFRKKAIRSGIGVGVFAWLCLGLAFRDAPLLANGLRKQWWSIPFQLIIATISIGALIALFQRKYKMARVLAVFQVGGIVMGWGLAQVPYVVVPALTLKQAAAPASVLWPVAITLVLGSCLLLPSFWYLYSIFQHKQSH